jgi:hypothetical protein
MGPGLENFLENFLANLKNFLGFDFDNGIR